MFAILQPLAMFAIDFFKSPRRLEAENLFLHHQLSIALRRAPPRADAHFIVVVFVGLHELEDLWFGHRQRHMPRGTIIAAGRNSRVPFNGAAWKIEARPSRGVVRAEGFEPPRLLSREPKSRASTSSATPASATADNGRAPVWVRGLSGGCSPAACGGSLSSGGSRYAPTTRNKMRWFQWIGGPARQRTSA
jgi:hypothetical protein